MAELAKIEPVPHTKNYRFGIALAAVVALLLVTAYLAIIITLARLSNSHGMGLISFANFEWFRMALK